MPILNVQNNETLLKQMRDELDEAKRKLERAINEKNELKIMNNQLENKVRIWFSFIVFRVKNVNLINKKLFVFFKLMNLQTDYVEEHAANAGTMDLLEVESSERVRLERELNELRVLNYFCYCCSCCCFFMTCH